MDQSSLTKNMDKPLYVNIIEIQTKLTKDEITLEYIQEVVCDYFNLTLDMLKSKTRKKEIVQARQIGMYLSKERTSLSHSEIGSAFGGRDHATVIQAHKATRNLIEINKKSD